MLKLGRKTNKHVFFKRWEFYMYAPRVKHVSGSGNQKWEHNKPPSSQGAFKGNFKYRIYIYIPLKATVIGVDTCLTHGV